MNWIFKIFFQILLAITCPLLGLPLTLKYLENEGNMINSSVSLQCISGFLPRDIVVLTCENDGSWNGTPPNCTAGKFNCNGNKISEVHMKVKESNHFTIVIMINYYCFSISLNIA